jgi:hypothetical protein
MEGNAAKDYARGIHTYYAFKRNCSAHVCIESNPPLCAPHEITELRPRIVGEDRKNASITYSYTISSYGYSIYVYIYTKT